MYTRNLAGWSLIVTLLCAWGCASAYLPPSGRADLKGITSLSMQDSFAAEPTAQFPTGIAVVRVQTSRYQNYHTRHHGGVHGEGRFSVVTTREVEADLDIERIQSLQGVAGIVGLNSLLIPDTLQSDQDLREAAARLKAEMLLLYTFQTTFHREDRLEALKTVTLGILPSRKITANVTASALLIDTRTGFIYAALEATKRDDTLANAWTSEGSADRLRRDLEGEAFKALVDEFVANWPRVVERAGQGK